MAKQQKQQWFVFEVDDHARDLIDQRITHMVVTSKFPTKKAVFEAYNKKGYARKVKEVFTLKQYVERYGIKNAQRVLLETKPHWIGECVTSVMAAK